MDTCETPMTRGNMGAIFGMPVYSSPYATTRAQFRSPRSKKKRMRKKFAKKPENFREAPAAYMMTEQGRQMVMHPDVMRAVIEASKGQDEAHFVKWG